CPQHISPAECSCAVCLSGRACSRCGHPAQLPDGLRERLVLPQWGRLPRLRSWLARPGGSAWLLSGIACGHYTPGSLPELAPAGMEIAGVGLCIRLRIA